MSAPRAEGSTATRGGNQELGRGGATVYGDEIEGGREMGTGAAHREEDDGELVRGRG